MDDRLFVKIILPHEAVTFENITEWLEQLVIFEPTKMRTHMTERSFNSNTLYKDLERITKKDGYFQLDLKDDTSSFTVNKSIGLPSILAIYDQPLTERLTLEVLMRRFTSIFDRHHGIVGYAVSEKDHFLQNRGDDKESLPGHNHFAADLWFGSAWKMWFGNRYYSYIGKEKLLAFRYGYEKKELEQGSICITLYKEVWDCGWPENRQIQLMFRREAGMDLIAHSLKKKRY